MFIGTWSWPRPYNLMFDFFRPKILRCSEVALEQFWIQKSFCPAANIRLGHIIVPVGGTNQHHIFRSLVQTCCISCRPNFSVSIVLRVKTRFCPAHGTKRVFRFGASTTNGVTKWCCCRDSADRYFFIFLPLSPFSVCCSPISASISCWADFTATHNPTIISAQIYIQQ